MDPASYVIAKPTWLLRWCRGWVILWRYIVFALWFSLFSLPNYFVSGLLLGPAVTEGHPRKILACFAVWAVVALINLPIALCLASETTGYFRSKREQRDEPPSFSD
jgi:hypothetical protein